MKYSFDFDVHGHFHTEVEAETEAEARKIAENNFSEADFGALENLEGDVYYVEDENGEGTYLM